jgi:uncharacterized membrane protein
VNFPDAHAVGAAAAAFLASFVEFLEALTVVLAVGAMRGWRNALAGAAAAMAILAAVLAAIGPRAALPAAPLRLVVGVLTLMFGLRWLRKAVLRAAGLIPLHDEAAEYDRTRARLGAGRARLGSARGAGWDGVALAAAFQVVMMEGFEVVLIVAAVGAGGGALLPASWGASAALLTVLLLGVVLHRPITRVPENALKCGVGVMLCAFGMFWAGEAIGMHWPGGEWALPLLGVMWAASALAMIQAIRA